MSAITVAITFVLMLVANSLASQLPSGVLPWRD
jgi:iron(III) transport system permease protein